jgi:hypothetical protein
MREGRQFLDDGIHYSRGVGSYHFVMGKDKLVIKGEVGTEWRLGAH